MALPQDKNPPLRNSTTYQIPIHEKGLTYASSNPSIVTISENGVVNVVGEGNALVFITDEENNFTSLTITAMSVDSVPYITGDVNGDDNIDASDAANLLMFSAMMGAGTNAGLTDDQSIACDNYFHGDAPLLLLCYENNAELATLRAVNYFLTRFLGELIPNMFCDGFFTNEMYQIAKDFLQSSNSQNFYQITRRKILKVTCNLLHDML